MRIGAIVAVVAGNDRIAGVINQWIAVLIKSVARSGRLVLKALSHGVNSIGINGDGEDNFKCVSQLQRSAAGDRLRRIR